MQRALFLVSLLALAAGCDGGVTGRGGDGGAMDAGRSDGATDAFVPTDAVFPDGARPDAWAPDAWSADAFVADTGVDAFAPTDAGSACGAEMALHCGSTLGLDPSTLYACSGGPPEVVQHCAGTCIVGSGGAADACPCPAGDGDYCGARVPGGASNVIYHCAGGHFSALHTCATSCTGGSGASDACAPCPSGNGAYCGGSVGGDAWVLYQCSGGVITPQATCQSTCSPQPPGVPDRCAPCDSGAGTYCGSGAHGDPNTLYDCHADGTISPNTVCMGTCHVSPPGTPDYCPGTCAGGLVCGNLQWWNSALTYGPYRLTNGGITWWDTDLAVGDRTPVQLRHDSMLIQAPVEPWGWQPRFRDMVTGETFQFLHLHPDAQYTTTVGMVYCAGTIVGLSGGADPSTGYDTYSTGAHLCLETVNDYRAVFPAGTDSCH